MKKLCKQPFTAIEIDHKGDVYTCCPAYINFNKIGNIWDNTLEEIWYSDFAIEHRKKILNNDYSLCNRDMCRQFNFEEEGSSIYTEKPPLPKYITLAYDRECNLCCITCRDEKYKNSQSQNELYNNKIDSLLLPLLADAEILALSGSGEALYSQHSRLLIKKIAEYNQKLLFNINTNGLLFNEANCKQLGIFGRINEVFVSLPSLKEKTYNNIMLGSNLKIVKNNIEKMAIMQNQGYINKVTINMVVSVMNYKEIPNLINFAKKLNIGITISQYDNWGTKFGEKYDSVAVWKQEHKEYNNLKKILRQQCLNYSKCTCSPLFLRLANKESVFF